jgi:RluA family pseudouridine synthase
MVRNIAGYKFATLHNLRERRAHLHSLCNGLKGTILLSPEGINLFVAGAPEKIDTLLVELRSWPGLEGLEVKISESEDQPFNRMLVRLKKEIIAFGVPGIEPARRTSPKLSPHTLKQWLDEGRPVTLLDTRNDYEVKLGTFKKALTIGIDHFREFPEAVQKLPSQLKSQPIVMFCTGGIRCEKAGPFMESEGFQNIFQLEGGILKYFEECGGAHYDGECFVFDQRVGVDPSLQETDSTQCFQCLTPLTEGDQRDPRYVAGKSCSYCFQTAGQQLEANLKRRHESIHRIVTPLPGSRPYDNFRPVSVPTECDGQSVLEFLGTVVPHVSFEKWEELIADGLLLNRHHHRVTTSQRVIAGERYLRKMPSLVEPDVNGNITILHEDEALIVLNKPAPLPMHSGGRFNRNTLQYILNQVYYPQKPHPAHRLDANTTGVVLITRTRHFATRLQPQFDRGEVQKFYLVRVAGSPEEDFLECVAPISAEPAKIGSRTVDAESGLAAHTRFHVLKRDPDGTTLLEAQPLTGRTNQIRIHLWQMGHPVCGDRAYLPNAQVGDTQTLAPSDAPLCLHASRISFLHPLTGKRTEFTAPPPLWAIRDGLALIGKER